MVLADLRKLNLPRCVVLLVLVVVCGAQSHSEEFTMTYLEEELAISPGPNVHHSPSSDLSGVATFYWLAFDPHFEGELPPSHDEWTITRVKFYHFGQGSYRLSVVVIPHAEASGVYDNVYEINGVTSCDGCWEEIEVQVPINTYLDTYPGPLVGIVFEAIQEGDEDYPRIGIQLDDVHPWSSCFFDAGVPPSWYFATFFWDLGEHFPYNGDLAIEFDWVVGGSGAEAKTWSEIKEIYKW